MKLLNPVVATAITSLGISMKSPSGTTLRSPSRFTPTISGIPPSIDLLASLRVLKTKFSAFLVTLEVVDTFG